jgi:predicted DNA binding CopG/RHH family protein
MKKPWPVLGTDEEAERFVAEADLTEHDFSAMVPVHFELRRKDKSVSLCLPEALLDAVKRTAARLGIPYQRFMRQAIEQAVVAENTPQRRPSRAEEVN